MTAEPTLLPNEMMISAPFPLAANHLVRDDVVNIGHGEIAHARMRRSRKITQNGYTSTPNPVSYANGDRIHEDQTSCLELGTKVVLQRSAVANVLYVSTVPTPNTSANRSHRAA